MNNNVHAVGDEEWLFNNTIPNLEGWLAEGLCSAFSMPHQRNPCQLKPSKV